MKRYHSVAQFKHKQPLSLLLIATFFLCLFSGFSWSHLDTSNTTSLRASCCSSQTNHADAQEHHTSKGFCTIEKVISDSSTDHIASFDINTLDYFVEEQPAIIVSTLTRVSSTWFQRLRRHSFFKRYYASHAPPQIA